MKFIVTHLYCAKYTEIKYFIQLYKSMFCIQDSTKDFWYVWVIHGNSWMGILNCVSWFASIALNFNVFCVAYTIQIQSYKVLLRSSRIFCLILGILTFGKYFLTVSNKGDDDHLSLYFVYLNYPPMWREIDC